MRISEVYKHVNYIMDENKGNGTFDEDKYKIIFSYKRSKFFFSN